MRPEGEVIERRTEVDGEISLCRQGETLQIVLPGGRVVASDRPRVEIPLAELSMTAHQGRDDVRILVAGLGMGRLVAAVLAQPGVVRVDVVEMSQAIIDWNRGPLAEVAGRPLEDRRVVVHCRELGAFARDVTRGAIPGAPPEGWHGLLLDIDQGPSAVTRPGNASFYTAEGLSSLEPLLRGGGVLALWSAVRDVELLSRMHAQLKNVAEVVIPVEVDGSSTLDYVYRGRRAASPPTGVAGPSN